MSGVRVVESSRTDRMSSTGGSTNLVKENWERMPLMSMNEITKSVCLEFLICVSQDYAIFPIGSTQETGIWPPVLLFLVTHRGQIPFFFSVVSDKRNDLILTWRISRIPRFNPGHHQLGEWVTKCVIRWSRQSNSGKVTSSGHLVFNTND